MHRLFPSPALLSRLRSTIEPESAGGSMPRCTPAGHSAVTEEDHRHHVGQWRRAPGGASEYPLPMIMCFMFNTFFFPSSCFEGPRSCSVPKVIRNDVAT